MITHGPRAGVTAGTPRDPSSQTGRETGRPPSPHNLLRMPPRGTPHSVYPVPSGHRSDGLLRHLSVPGLTVGLIMLWVALSPSLLPRAWWIIAVNVGLSMTYGYVIGDLLGRLAAWLSWPRMRARFRG